MKNIITRVVQAMSQGRSAVTWFILLGNQSTSPYFLVSLVLTKFKREIVEEYKIPNKVKGI